MNDFARALPPTCSQTRRNIGAARAAPSRGSEPSVVVPEDVGVEEVRSTGEPIVYVSTWRIKEGRFPDYQRFYSELVRTIRDLDRGVVAFYAFASEDSTEITNVHVFPDAATLERHMGVIGEQMGILPQELSPVTELMEPLGVQVYGVPEGRAAAMDRSLDEAGVPFASKERYLGGFGLADRPA
jgi:hypothetical protein